ncbi:MAG: aerobic carbon-monoxide dehydrogenase large subunit, partial [Hyphomicrobiales bacterium]|nr:aerobic carbon-monoxide dehydrogenase large subunit [Hyphomicrobiales bacterium]
MKIVDDNPSALSALDRPNSYIGRSVPRPNLKRLTEGRGQYVSDVTLPRMVHVAYVRSPHAHARITGIDMAAAKQAPGVVAVATGPELAKVITPWVGVLTHLKGIKSAPQHAIAIERACWQGEAVCAVVAKTRAQAEDACELVEVSYEVLPAVTDPETALDAGTPVIHPELGDNLTFERKHEAGEPDKGFAEADEVVEATFLFGRHTGVCNEPRAIIADWNPGEQRLTAYHATQAPHMMQNLFAKHLGLEEQQVRVVTKDVGGSFGIKVHTYADEMATVALSKLLRRPVKFVADRLESFVTDIHARDHRVTAKVGVKKDGTITAWEIDDLTGIGPYSVYPRTSGIEANQVVNLTGGPYTCPNYRARARVVFQNKNVMCQYRAVGHPIATAVTEGLVDLAAQKIGMDPLEIRRRNLIPDDAHPSQGPSGIKFEKLSHHETLARLDSMVDYAGLRAEQDRLRKQGIYRGLGVSFFVEVTNPSAAFYGVGGAKISAQDGATMKLDAQGNVSVHSGVTEQGQGAESVLAQVAASSFGVSIERVRVITGDTDNTPYGGGTWASRAAGIGGEAAWQAGKALRANVVAVAASILQADAKALDIRNGIVVDADTGRERIGLDEVARIAYFRPDTLPPGFQAELVATRHYVPRAYGFAFTNGAQASWLEVDTDTGFIKLLKHWCVEDCGTVINPQLVDEQVRGGIVQGLGAAIFEHCLYDERGQLLNGNMADYLVPMAAEMPDIVIGHVVTPTESSELGAKGVGEAG